MSMNEDHWLLGDPLGCPLKLSIKQITGLCTVVHCCAWGPHTKAERSLPFGSQDGEPAGDTSPRKTPSFPRLWLNGISPTHRRP